MNEKESLRKSMTKKIKSNKLQCMTCMEIIESKHRHDFVTCKCGNFSVDGGLDYLKRSAKSFNNPFKELGEFYEDSETDIS